MLLVTGCFGREAPAPGGETVPFEAPPPVSETVLDDSVETASEAIVSEVVAETEVAAVEEAEPRTLDLAPPPDPFAEARAACEKGGGRLAKGPGGTSSLCLKPTRDVGKTCSASTDCDGACLARSRTCAPFTPMLGCHEVLTNSGRRATVCVD